MRAGQAPGPDGRLGHPAGGGRPGPDPAGAQARDDRHLPQRAGPEEAPGLGVLHRPASQRARPPDPAAPRSGARRLRLDQRHAVRPRPPQELRRLGRPRLVLRQRAIELQADGGLGRRRHRPARRRRPGEGDQAEGPDPGLAGLHRGPGRDHGYQEDRRLQRRVPGGRVGLPAERQRRPALQLLRRLSRQAEPGSPQPAEPHRPHPGRHYPDQHRRGPCHRSRGRHRRRPRHDHGQPRGDPVRRRLRLAPAADAVRRRPGRPPSRARHRRGRRPAGRRQPARPHVRADDLLHDLRPQPGHHTVLRRRGHQGGRPRRHLDGPNGLRSRWFRPQLAGPRHTGHPGTRAAMVLPVPQPGLPGPAEGGQALRADHHAHADLPEEPRHPAAGLGRPGRGAGHRPRLPDRTRRQPPAAGRDRADPRDDGQPSHRRPGQPRAEPGG